MLRPCQPIASLKVHGDTAVSLLEELETKHYRAVQVDDNFSSAIFDSLIDTLDGFTVFYDLILMSSANLTTP